MPLTRDATASGSTSSCIISASSRTVLTRTSFQSKNEVLSFSNTTSAMGGREFSRQAAISSDSSTGWS